MNRSRRLITVGGLAILCFMSGLWTGCTNLSEDTCPEGEFCCKTNDDCLAGSACIDGTCGDRGERLAPPCEQSGNPESDIDLDNDGYGDSDNRTNCPLDQRALDCDDTDTEVHPGARELCDGKDNNCDWEGASGDHRVDEFDCEASTDCGAAPSELRNFLDYECIDGTCVMRPVVQQEASGCDEIFVTCDSTEQAFTYEFDGQIHHATDVPSSCR